jgi:hypothetical protein
MRTKACSASCVDDSQRRKLETSVAIGSSPPHGREPGVGADAPWRLRIGASLVAGKRFARASVFTGKSLGQIQRNGDQDEIEVR